MGRTINQKQVNLLSGYNGGNKQNLLSGATVEKRVLPAGFYRLTILQIIAVISAFFVGYFYLYYLHGEYVPLLGLKISFTALCITVFLFAFSSLLSSLLTRKTSALALLILLEILGLSFAFFNGTRAWWVAVSIALLAVVIGTAHARREMNNMVYLNFYRISSVYFSKLVLAVAVLAAVFYYPTWELNDRPLPRSVFDQLFQVSSGIMGSFSLAMTSSTTVDDFISQAVTKQLEQDPAFQKLTPLLKEKQIKEATEKMLEKSGNNFGLGQVSPDTKLNDAVFGYLTQWIMNLKSQFASWFYLAWTAIVFILIFGVGKIFAYIASGVSFILIQLVLALRFIKIYDESSNKEIVGF